jgi:hypothetical protein
MYEVIKKVDELSGFEYEWVVKIHSPEAATGFANIESNQGSERMEYLRWLENPDSDESGTL